MMVGALAFNFVINAALSFGLSCLLVAAVLRGFRVGMDRFRALLLSLPWLKLAWDVAYGIPAGSFFWQRVQGVRQDFGSFQLGVGANQWGPLVQLRFGASAGGAHYPQSAAELLDSGLSRLSPLLPGLVATAVLLVSALLVLRRLFAWRLHARSRAGGSTQLLLRLGRRWGDVQVMRDASYRGVPYAVGFLHPRVIVSAEHYRRLSAAEREACVLHELSHIAHGDTLWSPLLALLGDVFWFLPGARWSIGRFRMLFELRADAAAVRHGASAIALASALVSTGELLGPAAPPAVGLGPAPQGLLRRRVRRLLEPGAEPAPRYGFQRPWLRALLVGLVCAAVLQSVFFGNQPPI